MKHFSIILALALCAFSLSQQSFGAGFTGIGTGATCNIKSITSRFSTSKGNYSVQGNCSGPSGATQAGAFGWTAEGAYTNHVAEEVIQVAPQAKLNPTGPNYGWRTKYSCPNDPWLTDVVCTVIAQADDSPLKDSALQIGWSQLRGKGPLTARYLYPAERTALNADRNSQLAAQAEEEKRRLNSRLKGGALAQQALLAPIIRSPTAGQRFLNQSTVPIKLSPPPQWPETAVGVDGSPVKTERSVSGYMVRIERKDSSGKWVPHTTLPVGALLAESPAGYTGFGAGAPPGGLTVPGAWRLSAQISVPVASAWSEWVEFGVIAPPSSSSVLKQPKAFGK